MLTVAVSWGLLILLPGFAVYAKPLPNSSPERQGMSSDRLELMKTMSQRYVDQGRVAGIVNLVLRNGKVVHFNATGQRGVDDKRPLAKDDLFRIYSMTKPITAVALMQLYEQGKFQLSDPLTKYVPEFEDLQVLDAQGKLHSVTKPMTMHHLLTHTTGMSYGFVPQFDPVDAEYAKSDIWAAKDLDDFAAKIGKLPLKFQPGSRYHYSIAVDITGLIVQRLSGMAFDEYLDKNIFKPLGMKDTFFAVPKSKQNRFLPNHFFNPETFELSDISNAPPPFNPRPNVALQDFTNVTLFSGGAGLVSTAMDYAKFAEMMRNGGSLNGVRILGPKTVSYMSVNHLKQGIAISGFGEAPNELDGNQSAARFNGLGFGLGFGVITDRVSAGVMGSDGEYSWGGAAGTIFWIDPVEELVVVSMIQLMVSPWPLRSDLKVATYQALTESYE
jgi:CubicO group peptidase (beta-lactamase class C family)